ncbi:dephospho-CoA kinase [Antarcticirhabdus aurantiaca]|uniref:Dephospho-CoA kinase n=1 Tax=Antarcticirhabdus aurantiaca TaxID=2606717 RepID=A0ACD4NZZ1_9HYPH|nr:dephospho-CoA kinase [Antarcticirhabdus aurantiaca]WAJ31624.1 dephospho-CoA kinase [Jeongeuplla avenae]
MIVLGLTGSIGMGKSTTAAMFEAEGVPVYSADAAVHRLYAGRAAPLVEAAFPGTVRSGVVDREALARAVLADPEARRRLEAIVHPMVREEEEAFLAAAREAGHPLAVLDIPLLFETGGEARCDAVVVVTAPSEVQRARVLARPGMTPERFDAILAAQMPDADKRARASVVIDTGGGLDPAREAVRAVVARYRDGDPPAQAADRKRG